MSSPLPGKRWHTREESGIRLDRELRWWHDDERIEHPRIIETFNTSLVPADDGRFQLQVGQDWCFITVEDAAYEVRAVDVNARGSLSLRLSDRTADELDAASLAVDTGSVLTCRVKQGRAKARFSRDAQFQLGSFLVRSASGEAVLKVGEQEFPVALVLEED